MPLPTWVINLDRRPDRWQAVSLQLAKVGIAASQLSAVDGRDPAVMRDIERGNSQTQGIFGPLTVPEVALAMSHRKALKEFLLTEYPAALILEDDVTVSSDLPSLLHSVDWWPQGTNVIKLDTNGAPEFRGKLCGMTECGRGIHQLIYCHIGAGGYLVNRTGARLVMNAPEHETMPFDHVMFDLRYSITARRLGGAQTVPAAVLHKEAMPDSDVDHERRRAQRHGRPSRVKRQIRMFPVKMRIMACRAVGATKKSVVEYRDGSE